MLRSMDFFSLMCSWVKMEKAQRVEIVFGSVVCGEERNTRMSSANTIYLRWAPANSNPCIEGFCLSACSRGYRIRINSFGDRGQPCLIPWQYLGGNIEKSSSPETPGRFPICTGRRTYNSKRGRQILYAYPMIATWGVWNVCGPHG